MELNIEEKKEVKEVSKDPDLAKIEPKNEYMRKLIKLVPKNVHKKTKERIIHFIRAINKDKLDLPSLKSLAFRGIPDELEALRPLVWRILLDYLPTRTSQWPEFL